MFGNDFLGSFDSSALELIVLPTEQCNFRCSYCYETFDHGRMPRSIVEAIKLLIETRAHELRSLHLNWLGGEPLLASDIVLEISSFAKAMMHDRFFASMTTNGYTLTRPLFAALLNCGVRKFQISLDGLGSVHDKSRKRADGHGTFDQIWGNLLDTRSSEANFEVVLRVHVSRENYDHTLALVEAITVNFGHDDRYRMFVREISRLGGGNDATLVQLLPPAKSALLRQIEERCNEQIQISHECDERSESYICYATKLNSLLIRSNGRVGKCTVALYDDENTIGHIRTDGTLQIDQQALRTWTGGLFTRNVAQMECPLSFKASLHNL